MQNNESKLNLKHESDRSYIDKLEPVLKNKLYDELNDNSTLY